MATEREGWMRLRALEQVEESGQRGLPVQPGWESWTQIQLVEDGLLQRAKDGLLMLTQEGAKMVDAARGSHAYVPSAMHQGECAICGNMQGSAIHSPFRRTETIIH